MAENVYVNVIFSAKLKAYLAFEREQVGSSLNDRNGIVHLLLPHHFVPDEAEQAGKVGALCVVLYEAQRTRKLFHPSIVLWGFRLIELRDGRALTLASPADEAKYQVVLLARQICAGL